jgi:release factor glutamine methyltransferase
VVIGKAIEKSCEILKNAGIQSFVLDTHLLMCHFLNVDRLYLLCHKNERLSNPEGFFDLVERRKNREPLQYITGKCEFMSMEFEVDKNVLVPRADTEILVEAVIDFAKDKRLKMLEIGTGSGCISISCGKNCPNLEIDAVDISALALSIAKRNGEKHKVPINFIQMDILKDFPRGRYDIVVSNPPYIKKNDIKSLMPEVQDFEPEIALDGGEDGLVFYRVIAEKAKGCSFVAFEVGYDQSKEVAEILKGHEYQNIKIIPDLSGINRVVTGRGQQQI